MKVEPFHLGKKAVGVMFLVEAALGKEHQVTKDDPNLKCPPKGFHSVVAMGRIEPNASSDMTLSIDGNEVIVPQSKPVPRKSSAMSSFTESEYVLYNDSQHKIRFVMAFEWPEEEDLSKNKAKMSESFGAAGGGNNGNVGGGDDFAAEDGSDDDDGGDDDGDEDYEE